MRALFAFCLCLAACSVEGDPREPSDVIAGTGGAGGATPGPPVVAPRGAELSTGGETRLRLAFGEAVDLEVQLTDDGDPIDSEPVVFDLVGQAKDSALSDLTDFTDAQGYATTTLRAGQRVAAFEVRAMTPGAREVSFDVAVSGAGFGTLNVVVQYDGSRELGDRFVRAHREQTCRELDVDADEPAIALVPGAESARLIALPAGIAYAVQAFARGDTGVVVAMGCLDDVAVVADTASDTIVALVDEPLAPAPTHALDLEVRAITGASAIGSTLRTAGEALMQESVLNNASVAPEGSFWLDTLDSALRDSDDDGSLVDLADALAMARAAAPGSGPDVALDRLLGIRDEGVLAAIDVVADDVRDAMRDLTLDGTLAIDAEAGSALVLLERIACKPVVDDDVELEVALEADEASEASVVLVEGEDGLQLTGVRFEPRLGALAVKALRRLFAKAVHGEELTALAGCNTVQQWLEDQTVVDASACDEGCVQAACAVGIERIRQSGQDALLATDEARPVAELSMTLALHDRDGDLIAEEMSSDTLVGEWRPSSEATQGDSLTGSATARAEPQ
jgi:hypothetical protein